MTAHHQLAFSDEGDPTGSPLVLSSSLGTTRAMWDPTMPALREFRVIRFDHLGHGESDVPGGPYSMEQLGGAVLGLLDSLEIERASYGGLSLGGALGQWLAINAPDRIDRLALLCTAAHFPTPETWAERATLVREQGCGAVAEMAMGRWFTADFNATRPDDIAYWTEMVAGTPAEGYAGCCEALASYDVRDRLGEITAPTLALAGADDPSTTPDSLQAIVDGVPDGRLVVIDHAAHLANVEQPDEVGRVLADHFRGATA